MKSLRWPTRRVATGASVRGESLEQPLEPRVLPQRVPHRVGPEQRHRHLAASRYAEQPFEQREGAVEIAGPAGSGASLTFVHVPEAKTVKNRLHIDVNPVGCDQADEVARLIRLGARRVDIGQGERSWVVLADPEGNEFCVLADRID